MNIFTKGELRIIKQCVYFEGWKSESENANQQLLDKIQRVIDDYCEHEYVSVPDYRAASITTNLGKCTPIIVRCKKCHMVFE